jgi:hypothetical protein
MGALGRPLLGVDSLDGGAGPLPIGRLGGVVGLEPEGRSGSVMWWVRR